VFKCVEWLSVADCREQQWLARGRGGRKGFGNEASRSRSRSSGMPHAFRWRARLIKDDFRIVLSKDSLLYFIISAIPLSNVKSSGAILPIWHLFLKLNVFWGFADFLVKMQVTRSRMVLILTLPTYLHTSGS